MNVNTTVYLVRTNGLWLQTESDIDEWADAVYALKGYGFEAEIRFKYPECFIVTDADESNVEKVLTEHGFEYATLVSE